jgi:hypothetical protein
MEFLLANLVNQEDLVEAAVEEFMVLEDLEEQEIHLLLTPHKEMMEELEVLKTLLLLHLKEAVAEVAVLHKQELIL